jgi:hypothetical protein
MTTLSSYALKSDADQDWVEVKLFDVYHRLILTILLVN